MLYWEEGQGRDERERGRGGKQWWCAMGSRTIPNMEVLVREDSFFLLKVTIFLVLEMATLVLDYYFKSSP